jgi:hypothetical protein
MTTTSQRSRTPPPAEQAGGSQPYCQLERMERRRQLHFRHLASSVPGRLLLEMREVRTRAFKPVWAACWSLLLSTLRDIPAVHCVSSWVAPLLTHPLLIAALSAILLAAKHPKEPCNRLHRWVVWVRMAALTVWLQGACIFTKLAVLTQG